MIIDEDTLVAETDALEREQLEEMNIADAELDRPMTGAELARQDYAELLGADEEMVTLEEVVNLMQKMQRNPRAKQSLKLFLEDHILRVKQAPLLGKNPGFLYVQMKHDENGGWDYGGKISPEGLWCPVGGVPAWLPGLLRAFAHDPVGFAGKHGQVTGRCIACGRELTEPKSIALGYGPVCIKGYL